MSKRRLLRGFNAPVELLAELTGRSPSTIRRAQSHGPSKRLVEELALIGRMMGAPVRRRAKPRKPGSRKLEPRKVAPKPRQLPVKKRSLPRREPAPGRKPERKRPLPVKRRPVAKKPLPRKPPRKPRRPLPAKPKPKGKKPLPKRLRPKVQKPKGQLPKRPSPKVQKPKGLHPKRRYPSFMAQAMAAETLILDKLGRLQEILEFMERGLDMTVKAFTNMDATVDGELRLRNLPSLWRTVKGMPELQATLSEAIRAMGAFPSKPEMGGAFWVSFGMRFGPKNKREIEDMAKFYKRFRGLLQVGAHHTSAQTLSTILNNVAAIKYLVERLWAKRDLPPVQLLVRVVWTPRGDRPGRFKGEEGIKS